MRGIGGDLKQDCAGSDKRFSFCFPAKNPNSRHLAVFEAPIDALSHATLQQRNGWEWDGHRLSLGGTADVALIAFLERNPQITRVALHLDFDAAGITAMRKIKTRLAADSRFKHIRVSINPPRKGKDYNEALLHDVNLEREQKQSTRRREAAQTEDKVPEIVEISRALKNPRIKISGIFQRIFMRKHFNQTVETGR